MHNDIQRVQTEILQKCGSLAIDMNILPLAFDLLSKVLNNDPFDIKTLLLLSNAYLKNNNFINVIHLLINPINSKASKVLTNILIWQYLAVSYYRLNRFDDANHAITQALSLFEETNRYKNVMNLESQNKKKSNETNDDNDHIEIEIPTESEQKLYLLRSRILLLMDCRINQLEEILPIFDKCILFFEKLNNIDYYLNVLITRAQFFKKFNNTINCKNDLIYVINLLNENRDNLKIDNFLNKVSYTYHYLASLEYEESIDNYSTCIKLINEATINYPHMISTVSRLSMLETQLIFLNGTKDEVNNIIKRLELEVLLYQPKYQSMVYYMISRLLLKQDLRNNVNSAFQYYQNALKITPNKPWIWISIASLYLELGQFDDALSTYTQAVNKSLHNDDIPNDNSVKIFSSDSSIPSNPSSVNLLASFEIKYNNIFAAIAWFGISQVYIATEHYNEAIDAINKSLKLFKIEKDTNNVNKLKTLLNDLAILKANNKISTIKNTLQVNTGNELTNDRHIDIDDKDSNNRMNYYKPNIPMSIMIELNNCRDGKIFRTIEEVENEDICSLGINETEETIKQESQEHLESETIDLTNDNVIIARNHKIERHSLNSENYMAKINERPSIQTNPNHIQNTYDGIGHKNMSPVNGSQGNYGYYDRLMERNSFDASHIYRQNEDVHQYHRLDDYNRREYRNGISDPYKHSHGTLRSGQLSMPVLLPEQQGALPISTNAHQTSLLYQQVSRNPYIPYQYNISGNILPQNEYPFSTTVNSNQVPINYSMNVPSTQMQQFPNFGQYKTNHHIPSQMQYQPHNIAYTISKNNNPQKQSFSNETIMHHPNSMVTMRSIGNNNSDNHNNNNYNHDIHGNTDNTNSQYK